MLPLYRISFLKPEVIYFAYSLFILLIGILRVRSHSSTAENFDAFRLQLRNSNSANQKVPLGKMLKGYLRVIEAIKSETSTKISHSFKNSNSTSESMPNNTIKMNGESLYKRLNNSRNHNTNNMQGQSNVKKEQRNPKYDNSKKHFSNGNHRPKNYNKRHPGAYYKKYVENSHMFRRELATSIFASENATLSEYDDEISEKESRKRKADYSEMNTKASPQYVSSELTGQVDASTLQESQPSEDTTRKNDSINPESSSDTTMNNEDIVLNKKYFATSTTTSVKRKRKNNSKQSSTAEANTLRQNEITEVNTNLTVVFDNESSNQSIAGTNDNFTTELYVTVSPRNAFKAKRNIDHSKLSKVPESTIKDYHKQNIVVSGLPNSIKEKPENYFEATTPKDIYQNIPEKEMLSNDISLISSDSDISSKKYINAENEKLSQNKIKQFREIQGIKNEENIDYEMSSELTDYPTRFTSQRGKAFFNAKINPRKLLKSQHKNSYFNNGLQTDNERMSENHHAVDPVDRPSYLQKYLQDENQKKEDAEYDYELVSSTGIPSTSKLIRKMKHNFPTMPFHDKHDIYLDRGHPVDAGHKGKLTDQNAHSLGKQHEFMKQKDHKNPKTMDSTVNLFEKHKVKKFNQNSGDSEYESNTKRFEDETLITDMNTEIYSTENEQEKGYTEYVNLQKYSQYENKKKYDTEYDYEGISSTEIPSTTKAIRKMKHNFQSTPFHDKPSDYLKRVPVQSVDANYKGKSSEQNAHPLRKQHDFMKQKDKKQKTLDSAVNLLRKPKIKKFNRKSGKSEYESYSKRFEDESPITNMNTVIHNTENGPEKDDFEDINLQQYTPYGNKKKNTAEYDYEYSSTEIPSTIRKMKHHLESIPFHDKKNDNLEHFHPVDASYKGELSKQNKHSLRKQQEFKKQNDRKKQKNLDSTVNSLNKSKIKNINQNYGELDYESNTKRFADETLITDINAEIYSTENNHEKEYAEYVNYEPLKQNKDKSDYVADSSSISANIEDAEYDGESISKRGETFNGKKMPDHESETQFSTDNLDYNYGVSTERNEIESRVRLIKQSNENPQNEIGEKKEIRIENYEGVTQSNNLDDENEENSSLYNAKEETSRTFPINMIKNKIENSRFMNNGTNKEMLYSHSSSQRILQKKNKEANQKQSHETDDEYVYEDYPKQRDFIKDTNRNVQIGEVAEKDQYKRKFDNSDETSSTEESNLSPSDSTEDGSNTDLKKDDTENKYPEQQYQYDIGSESNSRLLDLTTSFYPNIQFRNVKHKNSNTMDYNMKSEQSPTSNLFNAEESTSAFDDLPNFGSTTDSFASFSSSSGMYDVGNAEKPFRNFNVHKKDIPNKLKQFSNSQRYDDENDIESEDNNIYATYAETLQNMKTMPDETTAWLETETTSAISANEDSTAESDERSLNGESEGEEYYESIANKNKNSDTFY